MNKLVSLLTPTRNPIPWLRKMLNSVKSTAHRYDEIEILLWVDDDDEQRIAALPKLQREFSVRGVIGPRGRGYMEFGTYLDALAATATGRWAWMFDDDAWIEGNTWQQQLAAIPCDLVHGPAVQCEFYTLGGSRYHSGPEGFPPGLIVPMALAKILQHRVPCDSQWLDESRRRGWPVEHLNGINFCHEGRAR